MHGPFGLGSWVVPSGVNPRILHPQIRQSGGFPSGEHNDVSAFFKIYRIRIVSKTIFEHIVVHLCCILSPYETLSVPAPPDLASNSAVSQRKPRPTPPVRSSELCIGSWPDQARYPVEPQWIGISSVTGHHGQFSLDSARTLSNGLRVPNNTIFPAITSYYIYRKDCHTPYRYAKSALKALTALADQS